MKIAVVGLWHLGYVTAACLAEAGLDVIAYDAKLERGQTPLFEPGLDDLVQHGIQTKKLIFTDDLNQLVDADIIWITYDTPVDEHDIADVAFVTNEIEKTFPYLKKRATVVISSQVPVGTTRQLQKLCATQFPEKEILFACSPENLRLGKALHVFKHPDRVVIGMDSNSPLFSAAKLALEKLFEPFTHHLVWMSIESAEMTKHALNAFLATSVVFINELAILCERVGANASEVEKGLKTEERIGPKAYLRPGNAIGGGTLARDVNFLIQMGHAQHIETPLFSSLLTSNHAHKQWACRRVIEVLKDLKNKIIVTLGLTYKADTDTLRRSTAIETCQWFSQQGAKVVAYDPLVKQLPTDLSQFIHLKSSLQEALNDADAIIIATEWPEFSNLKIDELLVATKKPHVFDAGGFLAKNFSGDNRIKYFSVGKQA